MKEQNVREKRHSRSAAQPKSIEKISLTFDILYVVFAEIFVAFLNFFVSRAYFCLFQVTFNKREREIWQNTKVSRLYSLVRWSLFFASRACLASLSFSRQIILRIMNPDCQPSNGLGHLGRM